MPRTSAFANAAPGDAGPRARFLAVPLLATAACLAIILAAGELAVLVPPAWQGSWSAHVAGTQPHFVDRFFPFDAAWYQRIATYGYQWDPTHRELKQDVAFFPLWPLVLRLVKLCIASPVAARSAAVCLAAAFALASICAFHRLARRLLPARTADTATLLFALYPGASFLLLSYPTGLMNLLCILALLALMDENLVAAAALSGIVTASGPLGLGTALTVCSCAAVRTVTTWREASGGAPRWRALATFFALCALAVSGLAAFLLWQYVTLGDAFAFMKAQQAWALPPSWTQRVPRAMAQLLILPNFFAALHHLAQATRTTTLVALQASLESSLHSAALGLALIGVLASSRLASRPVLLQGIYTMALFIWFHSSSRPSNSTLRLTYCAVGMFLGIAWLLQNHPKLAVCVIAVSAMMLACGAFLTDAGYHVV